MRRVDKPVILFCDDGSEIELPSKWEICGHCRGNGTSSSYLGAFTSDDWHDLDDEWREDYMAGRFDRACDACDGLGRVRVADYGRMTDEQRAAYEAQLQDDAEYAAMVAAERRMGA